MVLYAFWPYSSLCVGIGQEQLAVGDPVFRTGNSRAFIRSEAATLPDIPTVAESVAGYEASSLYGVGAPRGTPAEIVNTLNREINAALADPKIKTRLAELGGTVVAGQPAEFGHSLASEVAKWARVINFAGMKPG